MVLVDGYEVELEKREGKRERRKEKGEEDGEGVRRDESVLAFQCYSLPQQAEAFACCAVCAAIYAPTHPARLSGRAVE
jgi:hypothetical protein